MTLKLICASFTVIFLAFAQERQTNEARVSSFELYDSLLRRVLALEDYESKLPIDSKRPPVLQRYFSTVSLTSEDSKRVLQAAQRANVDLKQNHEKALAFIRVAKGSQNRNFDTDKTMLHQFSVRRENALTSFKGELAGVLSATTFAALDRFLNTQAIANMHKASPAGRFPPLDVNGPRK